MSAPSVVVVIVCAIVIVISVNMSVASIFSYMIVVIIVSYISINKMFLQFNFEGCKRRTVLYVPWYTVPEFWTINPDHSTSIFY